MEAASWAPATAYIHPPTRETPMKPFQLPRWKLSSCCGHEFAKRRGRTDSRAGRAPRGGPSSRAPRSASPVSQRWRGFRLDPAGQGRTYPPLPPAASPVEGLIDFHVHTAPDVFGRALADDEEAALSKDRGMEAVVLEEPHGAHRGSRVDRAAPCPRHEGVRRNHPERICRRHQCRRRAVDVAHAGRAAVAWCGSRRSTRTTT